MKIKFKAIDLQGVKIKMDLGTAQSLMDQLRVLLKRCPQGESVYLVAEFLEGLEGEIE